MRYIIILALAFTFVYLTLAQDPQKIPLKERTEIKGVLIKYDKFRDQKTVATKPIDIGLGGGRETYICNAVFGYIVYSDKRVSPLVMIITPGGTGFGAAMAQGLDPQMGNAYLSPDSDVIILVGGQRYKLGKVSKDWGFYPNGDPKRSVAVEIPIKVLSAIAKADEWEMAVGSLEAKIVKRYMNRIREKFTTLDVQFNQDNSSTTR